MNQYKYTATPIKLLRLSVWLGMMLMCMAWLPAVSAQDSAVKDKPKNVLVIHSFHSGLKWVDDMQQGIVEVLSRRSDVKLQTEYLDMMRYLNVQVEAEMLALLSKKAKLTQYDLVIVCDNNAFDFVKKYREELYPGVTILFCGINGFQPEMLDGESELYGIRQDSYPAGTFKLAHQIQPGLKRFIVMADHTITGNAEREAAFQALGKEVNGVQVEYWTDMNVEELFQRLQGLDPKSEAVLFTVYNRDDLQSYLLDEDIISIISRHSNAPVYVNNSAHVGRGALGGQVISSRDQGIAVAELAMEFLSESSSHQIPVVAHSPFQIVVDYEAMKRWDINPAQIPPNAVILNKPVTLWDKYKTEIMVIVSIMLLEALALMVLGILFYRSKLKNARQIARKEQRYAIAQSAARICSIEWDLNLKTLIWSDQAKDVLGHHPGYWTSADQYFELIHEDDRERVRSHIYSAMDTEKTLNIDYRFRKVTGKYRWLRNRCEIIKDEQGNASKLFGVVQDITESRKLEKLYESFYQAMQASVTPMLITDKEGRIINANPSFERLFGCQGHEIEDQALWSFMASQEVFHDFGFKADEYQTLHNAYHDLIQGKGQHHWNREVLGITREGDILNLNLCINAIHGAQGEVQGFVAMPIDITAKTEEQHRILLECYQALSSLAETRDDETGQHLKRISTLCKAIAKASGQSTRFCEDIAIYSELHDIGKVGIPDAILLAPRKLTSDEYETMKTHAVLGHQILAGRQTLEMAAEIARWHHEHWDGRGYPDQISGDQIPLSSRIMAIADVYDALRSKRRYKDGWSHEASMAYLKEKAGTQFDPLLVDAFESVVDQIVLCYELDIVENVA